MAEAWFPLEAVYFAPALSLLGFVGFTTHFIHQGKHRGFVLALWASIILAGAAMIAAGLIAVNQNQPYHVVGPLIIIGASLVTSFGSTVYFVLKGYRDAEERKIAAHEL